MRGNYFLLLIQKGIISIWWGTPAWVHQIKKLEESMKQMSCVNQSTKILITVNAHSNNFKSYPSAHYLFGCLSLQMSNTTKCQFLLPSLSSEDSTANVCEKFLGGKRDHNMLLSCLHLHADRSIQRMPKGLPCVIFQIVQISFQLSHTR